jgi:hypothetical protein
LRLKSIFGKALHRAEALAAAVVRDGEIVRTPMGARLHPAVKEELAARSFVCRTLQKLGLNFEPLRTTRPATKGLINANEPRSVTPWQAQPSTS